MLAKANTSQHELLSESCNSITPTIQELQSIIASSANRLKNEAFVELPHEQLLVNMLDQVETIDFRERAGLAEDEYPRKQHYLIIVVEEIFKLAKRNRWDLCRRGDIFYLYNGAFWKPVEKDNLKWFLQQAAIHMGVEKYKALYYEFGDFLLKQFYQDAHLPTPSIDRHKVKINLSNGTFEIGLEEQRLYPPVPKDFLTYQLPFAFNEKAKAPLFQEFLDRVQPDKECQDILAEYLGYLFVSPSKLKLEKTLLLYGSGANGKSVFFEIVTALLGKDNISHYSLQSLTNEPAYCRALLATKLVNYASEINGKLEADTFKQLVSGEPVEVRLPYGQPSIMTDYAKLMFNCNELPADVEHTPAYFRRFLIIPFNVTIPEKEQDKQLADKIITTELSGIFNWVLAGLHRLLDKQKFTDSKAVRFQLEQYQVQSDSVKLFVSENAYKPDSDDYMLLKDFYHEYKVYCLEDGLHPVKKPNFQKRLNTIGIATQRRNLGNVVLVGKSRTL